MDYLEKLNKSQRESLLKFPAYVSLLAANHVASGEAEKKYAIKFSHIKTYTCDPMLAPFYRDADKIFKENIIRLDRELPKEKYKRDVAIENELKMLQKILQKLDDNDYATLFLRSMKSFKDHVSRSTRNVLEYFVFPLPFKGITD